jgi:hypothetical protein
MTKSELREAIFDSMVSAYYTSDLCTNVDSMEFDSLKICRASLEDGIMVFMEDLADTCIETMEENGVLKAKKQEPQI